MGASVLFSARKFPCRKGIFAVTLVLDPAAVSSIFNRTVLSPEVLEDIHFQQSHVLIGFGNGAINQGGVNPFFITAYEVGK
jgi:UDP-N-acetylglucosamine transferase subunit ALG13